MALPYYETLLTLLLSFSSLSLLFSPFQFSFCILLCRRVRFPFQIFNLKFRTLCFQVFTWEKVREATCEKKLRTCSHLITRAVHFERLFDTLRARSIPRKFCSKSIAELEFSACRHIREKLIIAWPCSIVYAVPTSSTLRNAYVPQFHKDWQHC